MTADVARAGGGSVMRDITMQIQFSDGTTRTTTGKEVAPGLAVAPHHSGGWHLVHVRSGQTIGVRRTLDIEQAAAAAMALGAVRNWDCHGSEIVADRSALGPHLRAVLNGWIEVPPFSMAPTDLNVATARTTR